MQVMQFNPSHATYATHAACWSEPTPLFHKRTISFILTKVLSKFLLEDRSLSVSDNASMLCWWWKASENHFQINPTQIQSNMFSFWTSPLEARHFLGNKFTKLTLGRVLQGFWDKISWVKRKSQLPFQRNYVNLGGPGWIVSEHHGH